MNQPANKTSKTIENILEEANRVHETLELLTTELLQAWRCYHIVSSIRRVYADKQINSLYYLFVTTRVSCENSVILTLVNLLLENKRYRTVNVFYLLRLIEALACKAMKFTGVVDAESVANVSATSAITLRILDQGLLEHISQDREQLDALEPVIERLKSFRHTSVAHLDRRWVNDPASLLSAPPLHQKEIEQAFDFLLGVVRRYSWYLGYEVRYKEHIESLLEDFEYIVGLVERENKRPDID
jgi:hypothetical protein